MKKQNSAMRENFPGDEKLKATTVAARWAPKQESDCFPAAYTQILSRRLHGLEGIDKTRPIHARVKMIVSKCSARGTVSTVQRRRNPLKGWRDAQGVEAGPAKLADGVQVELPGSAVLENMEGDSVINEHDHLPPS